MQKQPEYKTEDTSSFNPNSKANEPQIRSTHQFYFMTPESNQDRLEKWFFEPLRRMDRDEGFIILMVILPLYERYLRITHSQLFEGDGKGNFYKNHPVFKHIKQELSLKNKENAYHFWQIFRNGLMHKAMPGMDSLKWVLGETGIPVKYEDGWVKVDPLALRDRILTIIKGNKKLWSHGEGFPVIWLTS